MVSIGNNILYGYDRLPVLNKNITLFKVYL